MDKSSFSPELEERIRSGGIQVDDKWKVGRNIMKELISLYINENTAMAKFYLEGKEIIV